MRLQVLDAWFSAGSAAHPGVIPCRRGCDACCHGPFDISPADAALIAAGVAALPPSLRDQVRDRATEQLQRMAGLLPGWDMPWNLEIFSEEEIDAASAALAHAPCPALDADGACLIHAFRPATCRITGLAMRTPSGDVLENVCPIQERFPAYRALEAVPFDLDAFEEGAEAADEVAREAGWTETTIAGAIRRSDI